MAISKLCAKLVVVKDSSVINSFHHVTTAQNMMNTTILWTQLSTPNLNYPMYKHIYSLFIYILFT